MQRARELRLHTDCVHLFRRPSCVKGCFEGRGVPQTCRVPHRSGPSVLVVARSGVLVGGEHNGAGRLAVRRVGVGGKHRVKHNKQTPKVRFCRCRPGRGRRTSQAEEATGGRGYGDGGYGGACLCKAVQQSRVGDTRVFGSLGTGGK